MSASGARTLIDEELAAFLEGTVMIIIGSQAPGGMPEIARGVGASVEPGGAAFHLMVSAWQWPEAIANLRANGRIAVTFARPTDYESYQVKGRVTGIAPPTPQQQAFASRYVLRMRDALAALGVDPAISAPWREIGRAHV